MRIFDTKIELISVLFYILVLGMGLVAGYMLGGMKFVVLEIVIAVASLIAGWVVENQTRVDNDDMDD